MIRLRSQGGLPGASGDGCVSGASGCFRCFRGQPLLSAVDSASPGAYAAMLVRAMGAVKARASKSSGCPQKLRPQKLRSFQKLIDGVASPSGAGLVPQYPAYPTDPWPPQEVSVTLVGEFPRFRSEASTVGAATVDVGNRSDPDGSAWDGFIKLIDPDIDFVDGHFTMQLRPGSTSDVERIVIDDTVGEWGGVEGTEGKPADWFHAGWQPAYVKFNYVYYDEYTQFLYETPYTYTWTPERSSRKRYVNRNVLNLVRAGPRVAAAGSRVTVRVVGGGFDANDAASAQIWLRKDGAPVDVALYPPAKDENDDEIPARVVEFDLANAKRYRALEVDFDLAPDIPLGIYDIEVKVGDIVVDQYNTDSASLGFSWCGQHDGLVIARAMNIAKIESGDYIVPGSVRNTIRYVVPEGVAAEELAVERSDGTIVRSFTNPPSTPVAGESFAEFTWDGLDAAGDPLTEEHSPYSYVLILSLSGTRFRQGDRKVEEWEFATIIGDKPIADETLVTGIDEDTITVDTYEVKVKFHDEPGDPVVMGAYGVEGNQESPEGPPENDWDAHVWLMKDGTNFHIFYTTPSWPVDIKYEIVMESRGDMILDGVLNEWDMDDETDTFESKGTWEFGMNPADAAEPSRDFTETYEEVVE